MAMRSRFLRNSAISSVITRITAAMIPKTIAIFELTILTEISKIFPILEITDSTKTSQPRRNLRILRQKITAIANSDNCHQYIIRQLSRLVMSLNLTTLIFRKGLFV